MVLQLFKFKTIVHKNISNILNICSNIKQVINYDYYFITIIIIFINIKLDKNVIK